MPRQRHRPRLPENRDLKNLGGPWYFLSLDMEMATTFRSSPMPIMAVVLLKNITAKIINHLAFCHVGSFGCGSLPKIGTSVS